MKKRKGVQPPWQLGKWGGEIGVAHEVAVKAATPIRQVATTSGSDASANDRFIMSCPRRE